MLEGISKQKKIIEEGMKQNAQKEEDIFEEKAQKSCRLSNM